MIGNFGRVSLFAALTATCLLCAVAHATNIGPIAFGPSDYDNTANTVTSGPVQHHNQTTGLFRDVFWWSARNSAVGVGSADYINRGNSLILSGGSPQHAIFGPGPYTALNFTGNSPSGGQSYMSVYDTTPSDTNNQSLFDATVSGGYTVSADVLFAHPSHSVSGGVVAGFNEGLDGLALMAHQGGGNNNDNGTLDLIFQSAGTGTLLTQTTLPGLTTFVNAQWYRVSLQFSVTGGSWSMSGMVQNHTDPTNPNSALVVAPITTLSFSGTLAGSSLSNPGEVGVIAQANQAFTDNITDPLNPTVDNIGVSITNFAVVPEPSTLVLSALGLASMFALRRRSK